MPDRIGSAHAAAHQPRRPVPRARELRARPDTSAASRSSIRHDRARTAASGCAEVTALLRERLPLLPPLRWRLAEVPLGLDYPYWVDDRDFDLDFHVRELALPRRATTSSSPSRSARIIVAPARPRAAAVGAVPDPGPRGRPRRGADEDPPRGDRRAVAAPRSWACCSTSTPEGREVPSPTPSRTASTRRHSLEMLGRGLLGMPRYPLRVAALAAGARCRTSTRPAVRRRSRASGTLTQGRRHARAATAVSRAHEPGRAARRSSTAGSPRTGASPSASSRSTTSRRSRTRTA